MLFYVVSHFFLVDIIVFNWYLFFVNCCFYIWCLMLFLFCFFYLLFLVVRSLVVCVF